MRGKRRARELALQLLYQIDVSNDETAPSIDDLLSSTTDGDQYAEFLATGCVEKQKELDSHIAEWSENWDMERMAVIDRNVLRIGTFELLFCEDIPPKVAIDEAIEIARTYGDADSPGFVNGVLDGIYQGELEKTGGN